MASCANYTSDFRRISTPSSATSLHRPACRLLCCCPRSLSPPRRLQPLSCDRPATDERSLVSHRLQQHNPKRRGDLLCIDELGYMELDRRVPEILFQVLTERFTHV